MITVIAGLDEVDSIFADFATTIDACIRSGRTCMKPPSSHGVMTDFFTAIIREKAVNVALILISGAYHTSLVSYFTYRDLFAALVKVDSKFSFIIIFHYYQDLNY